MGPWFKQSIELQAAVAVADFRKLEGVIVAEVLAVHNSYGGADRVAIRPADLAAAAGWDKANVSRAATALVADGVLRRVEGPRGPVALAPDYTTWRKGQAPRFTPRELVFIAQAPQRAAQQAGQAPPQSPEEVVHPDNSGPEVVHPDNSEVVHPDNKKLSIQTTHSLQEEKGRKTPCPTQRGGESCLDRQPVRPSTTPHPAPPPPRLGGGAGPAAQGRPAGSPAGAKHAAGEHRQAAAVINDD